MKLCMFHPEDVPMERGWVGRIDGDHVVQLAAQTLESFFTGGGSAREHAVYPREAVRLLAPVLHPPSVRLFEGQDVFAFASPAAIVGPGARVSRPPCDKEPRGGLVVLPRLAGVVGAEGALAGFTILCEWRDPTCAPPKDRDFALGLGPVLLTADELQPDGLVANVEVGGEAALSEPFEDFDWWRARDLAAEGTTLRPGDLLGGPPSGLVPVPFGSDVAVEVSPVGSLAQSVQAG